MNSLINLENGEKKGWQWMTRSLENPRFFQIARLGYHNFFRGWCFFFTWQVKGNLIAAWLCHKSFGKNGWFPTNWKNVPRKKNTASLLHPPKKWTNVPIYKRRKKSHLPSISRGLHLLTIKESIILSSSLLKLTITASPNHPCFIFQPIHLWKASWWLKSEGFSILETSNHKWRYTLR